MERQEHFLCNRNCLVNFDPQQRAAVSAWQRRWSKRWCHLSQVCLTEIGRCVCVWLSLLLTSAVRSFIPAISTIRNSITKFACMETHFHIQARIFIDGTLVHLAVCAWKTHKTFLRKTRKYKVIFGGSQTQSFSRVLTLKEGIINSKLSLMRFIKELNRWDSDLGTVSSGSGFVSSRDQTMDVLLFRHMCKPLHYRTIIIEQ